MSKDRKIINFSDKSLLDFKKSKNISISTNVSSIKESKIGDIYDTKILYDVINNLCVKRINNKEEIQLTKKK